MRLNKLQRRIIRKLCRIHIENLLEISVASTGEYMIKGLNDFEDISSQISEYEKIQKKPSLLGSVKVKKIPTTLRKLLREVFPKRLKTDPSVNLLYYKLRLQETTFKRCN